MLTVDKNGKQHMANCGSNEEYEQKMGRSHQRTNAYLYLGSLHERTEYQHLLQQPELFGAKGGSPIDTLPHLRWSPQPSHHHSTQAITRQKVSMELRVPRPMVAAMTKER